MPKSYPDNLRLANWVNKQRAHKRKGKLSSDKVERLDSLGFSWDTIYQALEKFQTISKQDNGGEFNVNFEDF